MFRTLRGAKRATDALSGAMHLHRRILLGLALGAVLGIVVNVLMGAGHPLVVRANHWVAGPLGQVFLRSMSMVVMPLVFCSITLGVAGIGDLRRVGRLGVLTVGYFLATTAVAGAVGLILVNVVRPGAALDATVRADLLSTFAADAAEKVAASKSAVFGIDTFVQIVTRNPLKSAVDNDMLGVIFFALVFGAALTLITQARAKPLVDVLSATNDVTVKMVEIAMKVAPAGVAGLIFGVTSRFGFAVLEPLGLFVFIVLLGLGLHAALLMVFVVKLGAGLSPRVFLSRVRPSLITAFSTSSSSATLPTNIALAEDRLGISPRVAGFVLPIGSTMCMNGTALFEGVTVIFLCQVFAVDLSLAQMVIILVMSVLTAVGAAGVPGGSIPLLVGILALFGVPGEGIAIVIGVDRLLDMARTTVNVLGDLSCVVLVARTEDSWTPASLPPDSAVPLDQSPGWPAPGDVQPRV